MIDYLGTNLTEYKSFRQLELQFITTKQQNESLRSDMKSLRLAYQQKCKQVIEMKSEQLSEKLKLKNKNLKYKKLYRQIVDQIEANLACVKGLNQKSNTQNRGNDSNSDPLNQNRFSNNPLASQSMMNSSSNDKSIFIHLQEAQNLQKICSKLSDMTKDFLKTKQQHFQLNKKLQNADLQYKSESLQNEKAEKMIMKQIQNLERQLEGLNQVNMELEAKINIRDKERRKAEGQIRQLKQNNMDLQQRVEQLAREKQEKVEEDSQFALDFITFQLQTIQSFFTRLSQETKCSSQLSNLMSIIYSDYEELSEIFKQKLQIEYDLQELQQRYKSQKSASNNSDQSLLIETRRQIEAFRLQLLQQKEIFRQKEQYIEDHFAEYTKVNEAQLKVKNYSYELENRLYLQKRSCMETCERFTTTNPTARDILAKRFNNDGEKSEELKADTAHELNGKKYREQETVDKEDSTHFPTKKTSLKFKQTNNVEEIMNQIIKKDKDNLEKILKETRKSSIPIYLAR